jgi:inosose dehydratase
VSTLEPSATRRPGTLAERLIGAPISWGVCELPDWGATLDPDTVLSEMSSLGLRGTELGPVGYLPAEPTRLRALLERHRLRAIAAFVPVVFDPELRPGPADEALRAAASLAAAGGEVLVVAAVADAAWSPAPEPTAARIEALADGLEGLAPRIAGESMRMAVHPHVGSLIERAPVVSRLVELADVEWCLDTGHLLIGGVDPAGFAREHGARTCHVHLKDVDARLAREVAERRLTLPEATRLGLFRPLGDGDAGIAKVLGELERRGYRAWLTLEQDVIVEAGPGAGAASPIDDVARSVAFVRALDGGP